LTTPLFQYTSLFQCTPLFQYTPLMQQQLEMEKKSTSEQRGYIRGIFISQLDGSEGGPGEEAVHMPTSAQYTCHGAAFSKFPCSKFVCLEPCSRQNFSFLVCHTVAIQLHQGRIQVVRSDRDHRVLLSREALRPEGTPAMDLGLKFVIEKGGQRHNSVMVLAR